MQTLPSTSAYWNVRGPEFDTVHPRLQLIGRLIGELPGVRTMLDVGCGPAAMRRVVPPGIEYFGIDIASDVIAGLDDPAHFQVVNLDTVDGCFDDRRFDLVVCSGVFEYINDRERFMRLLRRKAAPGGHLILSFTNHQHLKDGLRWLHGRYTGYRDPHVNFMLVPAVRRLLADSGWTVLRYRSITKHGVEHPLLARFTRFPMNVLNRQYIFVCRRADDAGD